jgi:hypothetical protein
MTRGSLRFVQWLLSQRIQLAELRDVLNEQQTTSLRAQTAGTLSEPRA